MNRTIVSRMGDPGSDVPESNTGVWPDSAKGQGYNILQCLADPPEVSHPIYVVQQSPSHAESGDSDKTDPDPTSQGIVLTLCDGMGGSALSLKRDGWDKDLTKIIATEINPVARKVCDVANPATPDGFPGV